MSSNLFYFISDLHLSETTISLNKAFDDFLSYCEKHPPRKLFILGDLFDYYLGFDAVGSWGEALALKIAKLAQYNIELYFLPGNRDFLIDKSFLVKAKLVLLPDPDVLEFSGCRLLLSHGDRFCTNDKYHQTFRSISQSRLVKFLFLCLPKAYRLNIAKKVRKAGRDRTLVENEIMPVDEEMLSSLKKNNSTVLVHGHIHKPMIRTLLNNKEEYTQVVLPDWRTQAEFVEFDELSKQFTFKNL